MKYNVYVEQCLKYDWNWKLLFDRHWKMVQYNHLQINWVKHLYRAHSSAHCTPTCAPAVSFLYWLYIFKRSSFAPVADDKLIFKFLTAPMGEPENYGTVQVKGKFTQAEKRLHSWSPPLSHWPSPRVHWWAAFVGKMYVCTLKVSWLLL